MKINTKLSGHILRSAAVTALFSFIVVALTSALNLSSSFPKSANAVPAPGQAAANAQQSRTLTFAERVAYQRAIEDVYWRHRIWPKDRRDPKPSLDAVMTQAQLEAKVADYLRKSQALEDYWQRPTSAEQLQAEMDRMAKNTKQPEVLQELFHALGNDPFVIAECLARPALGSRLLSNWYGYDQRIHGELKQRAETDLQAHPSVDDMKQLSGKYEEIEFVKNDGAPEGRHQGSGHNLNLTSSEWDEMLAKLAPTLNGSAMVRTTGRDGLPGRPLSSTRRTTGPSEASPQEKVSILQEDETRYYATAVIEKTNDHLKLATVSWLKEPLDSWLAKMEKEPAAIAAPPADYHLPIISDGTGCVEDTWSATLAPPDGRIGHTAVWTGTEMITWGGFRSTQTMPLFNSGGRYSPSTDLWTTTTTNNAPTARYNHTAVWTGSQMVVWGGSDRAGNYFNTGGKYDPNTDTWTAITTSNAPPGRAYQTAVWTGSQMIVWGGINTSGSVNTGGRYDPNTDTWTATNTTGVPAAREYHSAVWSGTEMIVWGGYNGSYLNTGGRYQPGTDSWTATDLSNAPDPRQGHTAVWTGSEMIVWGGNGLNTGGKYNPATNIWTATSTTTAPDGRSSHTAVWTGSEMIVWGGSAGTYVNTGGRYNPNANSWTPTATTGAPTVRGGHTAIWTGNEMIVWGGTANTSYYSYSNIGGRYDPTIDNWAPTGETPSRRRYHTAVWTGSEMIVWGGFSQSDAGTQWNTGGEYDAATDMWSPTTIVNAPMARDSHMAVWTGTEMIVWGGYNFDAGYLNTGGRYNPSSDSWLGTAVANAPVGRDSHTAVWTGSQMIVWGGYDGTNSVNTGGRYNPASDTWAATSTTNAPDARYGHTTVWTGSEMIVWGGYYDTGGRYDPNTDTWIATSTVNAPTSRAGARGVWTGSEMIVWGGSFYDGTYHYLNTGGRYNPAADTWIATSVTNAPDGRSSHTAIWTGAEMIVWGGGQGLSGGFYNTGGRYNPGLDSWAATNTSNPPQARISHTAVWTGSQMVIWGGILYSNTDTNTGGQYCAQSGPVHPAFFSGEVPLGNGIYYLQFPNGTPFGYYSYLADPHWIYHFDMGYEYWFDANDGHGGIFFYDFASGHFFYSSPTFGFPYLYDFTLNTVLYYYPDPNNPGHYTTNPRYFFDFATGQIITM